MAKCYTFLLGLIGILATESVTRAEETVAAESQFQIAKLIGQLEAEDFATREAATNALIAAGPVAVSQVEQAARGESLEASLRAFKILEKWIAGSNQWKEEAAREFLYALSQSGEDENTRRKAQVCLTKNPRSKLFGSTKLEIVEFPLTIEADFALPVEMPVVVLVEDVMEEPVDIAEAVEEVDVAE